MTRVVALHAVVFWWATSGCIRPPEIVMVDRATALEQEAAGSFVEIEEKLSHAGVAPRPVPFTPAELEAVDVRPPPLVDNVDMTDADRIDELLLQHCVGEGRDALLVDTRSSCEGAADHVVALQLVDRVNRARGQIWAWMHEQKPALSIADLRRTWHEVHARDVVCAGWVQGADGTWHAKPC